MIEMQDARLGAVLAHLCARGVPATYQESLMAFDYIEAIDDHYEFMLGMGEFPFWGLTIWDQRHEGRDGDPVQYEAATHWFVDLGHDADPATVAARFLAASLRPGPAITGDRCIRCDDSRPLYVWTDADTATPYCTSHAYQEFPS